MKCSLSWKQLRPQEGWSRSHSCLTAGRRVESSIRTPSSLDRINLTQDCCLVSVCLSLTLSVCLWRGLSPAAEEESGPYCLLMSLWVCVQLSACYQHISWITWQTLIKLSGSNFWMVIDNWLTFAVTPIQDGCHSYANLVSTKCLYNATILIKNWATMTVHSWEWSPPATLCHEQMESCVWASGRKAQEVSNVPRQPINS